MDKTACSVQPVSFEFKKSQTTTSSKSWLALSSYPACIFKVKVSPQKTKLLIVFAKLQVLRN